ncbi:nitrite reductase small subunit [Mycolicibacterium parafortuitum]|uniref:Nitrite reductase small subunit n=1 Tax=Mycolicibacterium parafortuitum TaxID=39692 RepID=A0A7I7U145_MYCPF|nr:nitrite reductase small subunit NirD [Mycolicibacterium parafortuitum]PQD98775.1 nitrite reductase (NAD(P)H) small subunit [Mycobacterium sp. EPG1]BBY74116.1 nitrite reductase small subunit [Mycolicibacterium parafortuitum]
MTVINETQVWTTACRYDFLIPNRGVGVLLPGGAQAALFRLDDGTLRAVGNIDPFSGAAVMSRGIVGDRAGRATVQSPIKKQAFALDDGRCLDTPDDNPDHCLPVYATRITPDGDVQVGT